MMADALSMASPSNLNPQKRESVKASEEVSDIEFSEGDEDVKKVRDSMAQMLVLAMQGNMKSRKILEGIS